MQTRDHNLLGRFLLEYHGASLTPACRKLFLLGCIEPDWNLATYARGSLQYGFLRGHHAENGAKHLNRLVALLEKSGVEGPGEWFRLGAALHYLADSFTFAHNRTFTGGLRQHQIYERGLHTAFVEYLSRRHGGTIPADEESHRQYLAQRPSRETDCRYILGTALGLCSRLSGSWAPESFGIQRGGQSLYGEI